jgi:hypothetical protein
MHTRYRPEREQNAMPKFRVIEGGGPPKDDDPQYRGLTPAEASAALTCFWLASQLVRRTLAGWLVDGKRPTKDDLMSLAQELMATESLVEDLAKGPETDGHSLDGPIRGFQLQLAELNKAQDANNER